MVLCGTELTGIPILMHMVCTVACLCVLALCGNFKKNYLKFRLKVIIILVWRLKEHVFDIKNVT